MQIANIGVPSITRRKLKSNYPAIDEYDTTIQLWDGYICCYDWKSQAALVFLVLITLLQCDTSPAILPDTVCSVHTYIYTYIFIPPRYLHYDIFRYTTHFTLFQAVLCKLITGQTH